MKLLARVLLIYDRHKREDDFKTIKGFIEAQSKQTDEILKCIEEEGITHVIEMGDLYDRGYHKVGAQHADTMDEIAISDAVNGNYYGLIGNHLFLERDSNPEFYLIQPNNYAHLQPATKKKFRKQVIKVQDSLIIGNTQFSFFHYDKDNKNYIRPVAEGVKYHVGLYHDDEVVPNSVRAACNIPTQISSSYLNKIYSNVTIGFCAHVHVPIGKVYIQLSDGRKVPLFIQGSMLPTSSKESEIFQSVTLPILNIYEDSCNISTKEISCHIGDLKIYKDEDKITDSNRDKYIAKEYKAKATITKQEIAAAKSCVTFKEYLNKIDADEGHAGLYDLALNNKLNDLNVLGLIKR